MFQSCINTVKLKTTQNEFIAYKQHGRVAILLLVKLQAKGRVNIDELMKYPLGPVSFSLGTVDGYMTKTYKPKGA